MAQTISTDSGGLGGIASLISTAAPLIFGQGTKKGSSTTSSTSTTSPTNDPALLAILQNIVNTSLSNANDPSKTADMVNDIIRKANIAFTPTLGAAARSGLYNSSTVEQLARDSVANATSAASQAVLSYQTQQQQIASQGAQSLIQATGGKTTSTTGVTNETVNQGPTIPSQASSLLGLGLLGYQAFSQRKKLLDMLGLGDGSSGGTPTASVYTPSAEDLGTPWTEVLDTGTPWTAAPSGPVTAAAPFSTSAIDAAGNNPIIGLNSSSGEGGSLDFSSFIDNLPSSVGDAVTGIGNFISGAGDTISSAGDDVIKSILDIFDF